jgi:probable rRNA maturation factor
MLEISFHLKSPAWRKVFDKSNKAFTRALKNTFKAMDLPKRKFTVAVTFVSDREMQVLNRQYRNKDKPTNVLSFPMVEDFSELGQFPKDMEIELGDIVIAYETTMREAMVQGKQSGNHVSHLLIHGLLHLFGYDHMARTDAREMEHLEIAILKALKIANPY